jgi:hypothetical protein
MKHLETRLCSPDMSSGHFFCPRTLPFTLPTSPLTLPSPRWGEGEGTA